VAPPMTYTRRGLVLTVYSEGPLVMGALAFVLFPTRPLLLVVGILLSLAFGAPAGLAFWTGRREFGRPFERAVARATAAFAVLGACLVLAYFETTSVFPQSLRLRDLYAPWFFLGLALLADLAAILLLLWPLLPPGRRQVLHLTWIVGVLACAAYYVHGQAVVAGLIERSGGVAFVPAEATSYARDFVATVVRDWALALLSLRIGFWPGLYRALVRVVEAEEEAAREAASSLVGLPAE
jgi:hypothetical protein